MAGRIRMEMDARLPIHVTVAKKWSQKTIARNQEGIDGMGHSEGVSVGGGSVGVSPVGAVSVVAKGSGVAVAG